MFNINDNKDSTKIYQKALNDLVDKTNIPINFELPTVESIKEERDKWIKRYEEFQKKIGRDSKKKRKDIKEAPITLTAGPFSCTIYKNNIKYFIEREVKKKINYGEYYNKSRTIEQEISGGKGNQTLLRIDYTPKMSHFFIQAFENEAEFRIELDKHPEKYPPGSVCYLRAEEKAFFVSPEGLILFMSGNDFLPDALKQIEQIPIELEETEIKTFEVNRKEWLENVE